MVDVQPALMRDVLAIRQWRNEASVRWSSGNRAAIGLGEHLRWFWRARSSVNRRDAPREPSAPPLWAEAAARAADAAARDVVDGAWRG